MTMRLYPLVLAALLAAPSAPALRAEPSWPIELLDPAAVEGTPADLLLPMPCGAAMAFQRVVVPTDPADPLADLAITLGQDGTENGYMEAPRTEYLRGPFDAGADGTAYFIGRYELTEGQYRSLTGDCAEPNRKDRIARGNISWLEAQQLADAYSRYLIETAPPELPRRGMALGFVRLPTEAEWEYATRGGAAVSPDSFAAPRFYAEGQLEDYAVYIAPGSSRGKVTAVGLKKPNPLGLYDVYGNVEELMLEPFRLTLPGRSLGQPGGVIARGGSATSQDSQIYSAQRTEYTPYGPSGRNTNPGIGLRFVLSAHLFSSDLFLDTVKASWSSERADTSAPTPKSPTTVAAPDPKPETLDADEARHLLQRTGFGAHPAEIAALTSQSRDAAIAGIIAGLRTAATTVPPFADGPVPAHWMADDLSGPEAGAFRADRRADAETLEEWWLAEMASTPSPQTERMVLFWHDLLQSDFQATQAEVVSLARQNRTLRALGSGPLRDLLQALLRDAATLRTYSAELNSTLTPETSLAEFFLSLTGEPASAEDAAKAARLLAGLGVNDLGGLQTTFDPWRSDATPLTLLGREVASPDDLVAAIAAHPGTARTIALRGWLTFVSNSAPSDAVLDTVTARYISGGTTFGALLQALLEQPEFWDANNADSLLRTPLDLIVSAIRSTGQPVADSARLRQAVTALGPSLYLEAANSPATPDTPETRQRVLADLFAGDTLATPLPAGPVRTDRIFVRYAAEDFAGPPVMLVTAFKKRDDYLDTVWQSERIATVGGKDTTRFPVGQPPHNWQIAEIAFDPKADYDLIGVGFTNDRCCEELGKTGDRNLLIDWMQLGDQRYSARGAKIRGRCSDGEQTDGVLNCEGTVLFERAGTARLPDAPRRIDVPGSKLAVARVATLRASLLRPGSAISEFSFGLHGLRYGDFAADALAVTLRLRARGMPELVLDPARCSPACLPGDWPVRDGGQDGVLVLPLGTGGAQAVAYDGLTDDQRRLVAALWMALPDIMTEAVKGRHAKDTPLQRRLGAWQTRMAELAGDIAASNHARLVRSSPLQVVPLADGPFAVTRQILPVTRPAERDPLDRTAPDAAAALRRVTDPAFSYR